MFHVNLGQGLGFQRAQSWRLKGWKIPFSWKRSKIMWAPKQLQVQLCHDLGLLTFCPRQKKLQMSNSRYRIEAEKKHTSPLQNSGLTEPVGPQDPPQRLTWNMLANMEKSGNIWVPKHLSLLPRFRLVAFFWNCFWNQWFWQVPFVDTKKASNEQF